MFLSTLAKVDLFRCLYLSTNFERNAGFVAELKGKMCKFENTNFKIRSYIN